MSEASGRTAFEQMGRVTQFCLGGGSETADLMTELRANGFNEGLYGLLITMIDTIVRWESIEGTPYNYLTEVVESTERTVSLSRSDLRTLYSNFREYLQGEYIFNDFQESNIKLNYVFNQGRYRVKQDSDLERTIRFFVENYQQGRWLNTLLVKEKDKKFYGYSHGIDNNRQAYLDKIISERNELPYTIIGGKKVEMNIRNSKTKAPDKNDYFIYPKFKQYVAEQFENELYEKAVTSSAIARQNQGSYA